MRLRLIAVVPILICIVCSCALADAGADLKRGTDLIAAKKYDDAIKALAGIEKADPSLGQQSNQLLGDCYRLKSDTAHAIPYYQAARTKYTVSANLDEQIRRSLMYCYIDLGQWPDVERDIAELSKAFSEDSGSWYDSVARHYCMSGIASRAISNAQKAVATLAQYPKDPKGPTYIAALAWAYICGYDTGKAAPLIDEIASKYPDAPAVSHQARAALYVHQHKMDEAVQELRTALTSKGALDMWLSRRLVSDIAAANPTTAGKLLEPIADSFRLLGDYPKAVSYYMPLTTGKPSADVLEHLGDCYRLQSDNAKAIPAYQAAHLVKGIPAEQDKRVRRWLIECQINAGEWAGVEKGIGQASGEFPELAGRWYWSLAKHYCVTGAPSQGVTAAQTAIDTLAKYPGDPNGANYKSTLVWAYIDSNDIDKANVLISQITRDYPKLPAIPHFLNGAVLQHQDKPMEALAEIKYALGPVPGIVNTWWIGKLIEKIRAQMPSPDVQTLLSLGECNSILGNNVPAIDCYVAARQRKKLTGEQDKQVRKELVRLYLKVDDCLAASNHGLIDDVISEMERQYWAACLSHDGMRQYQCKTKLQTCYALAGKWDRAVALSEELVREHPDMPTLKRGLMFAYLDGRQYEKGSAVGKELLDKMPERAPEILTVIAECMYPLGRGKEAVEFQDEYFTKHPDKKFDADWTKARTAYYAERDWKKSAAMLRKLIADYPDCPREAREMLADALDQDGQTDAAVSAIDGLLGTASEPQRSALLMKKARVYFLGKRYREAIGAFKTVRESKATPSELAAEATYKSGLCYFEIGYQDSASTCMREAARQFPDSLWAVRATEAAVRWSAPQPAGQ